jgi:hypothetical protein
MTLVLTPDGPGTTVTVRDSGGGLRSAPRGASGLIGQFRSGPVGVATLALSKAGARAIYGDPSDQFEASMCLDDLYAEFEPPVMNVRVTDGQEVVSAGHTLWDRNPNRSFMHRTAQTARGTFATVVPDSGGKWAGSRRAQVGDETNAAGIATAVTSTTTFATGLTLTSLADVYAAGSLYIENDASSPYTIYSNTTAGVLTIEGEFSADAQNGTGTLTGKWYITRGFSADEECCIVVGQDPQPGKRFALSQQRRYDKDDFTWEQVIATGPLSLDGEDSSIGWTSAWDANWPKDWGDPIIDFTTAYTGANVERKFPCNFSEIPTVLTESGNKTVVTYQWYRWSAETGNTGNPYVESVVPTSPDDVTTHTITVDFTAATTVNITWTLPDGNTFTSTGVTIGSVHSPGHALLAKVHVVAGAVGAVSGDTLTIECEPLLSDLTSREAYFYPVANTVDGTSTHRLLIASNTYNTLTVNYTSLIATYGAAVSTGASVTGTVDVATGTWVATQTLIFTLDGHAATTFTSPGGGKTNIAVIITELELQDTANLFSFTQDSTGTKLVVKSAQSLGTSSTVLVGAGSANSTFGFTATNSYSGTDGVPFRLEYKAPAWGGFDGGNTIANSVYTKALDTDDSAFEQFLGRNLGLVRIGAPSVFTAAVKNAVALFSAKVGFLGVVDFDTSVYDVATPGEAMIADMIGNETRCDYVEHYGPSALMLPNKKQTAFVVRSAMGAVMGIRARLANVGVDGERGLHIPAANVNEQGLIARADTLPYDIHTATRRLPVGLMNDAGIVCILKEGPNVYLWGDRMYSKGTTRDGRNYKVTARAVAYHIARDLHVTTRPFIFKTISQGRLGEVQVAIRGKLKQYWRDGWFADTNGLGFDDQVTVTLPKALNTAAEQQAGRVHVSVGFAPRSSIEDLLITITPDQVTVS